MQTLSEFVKTKRKEANLTQQEFAEKSGVALTVIRKIEQEKGGLNMDKVNQVLKMFGHELAPVNSKELRIKKFIEQPEVDQLPFVGQQKTYYLNEENKYTSPFIKAEFGEKYALEQPHYNSIRCCFSNGFGQKEGFYYSSGKTILIEYDFIFLSFECINKPDSEIEITLKRIE